MRIERRGINRIVPLAVAAAFLVVAPLIASPGTTSTAPAAAAAPAPAAGSPSPAASAPAAPVLPPYELRIAGQDIAAASPEEAAKKQVCALGSPEGSWRLVVTPSAGEDGVDWTTIELEDANGAGRKKVDRVYRLSGPCWAPDGSYFVYGEGGAVKIAAPGHSPSLLYQDSSSPRGGIFPALAGHFRWGVGMINLSFLIVDDPRKEFPQTSRITLAVRR